MIEGNNSILDCVSTSTDNATVMFLHVSVICSQGRGSGRQTPPNESVETAVKLVIETKIRLYIHYIYSHTTNLNEN